MTEAPRQLALDLPVEPRLGLEDFLVGSSNEAAYAFVESWPDWPDRVLRLEGPEGAGKSHLAAIWAARSDAHSVRASGLDAATAVEMIASPALLVEDADGGLADEAAFFHLLNQFRESGRSILVTSRLPPDRWGLATPDLLSRLRLAPSATIHAPDDALLRALIVKLFIDRQLVVDVGVIDYLVVRIERSFAAAADAVARLDRHALSAGRRITRPLAAAILAQGASDEEGELHE